MCMSYALLGDRAFDKRAKQMPSALASLLAFKENTPLTNRPGCPARRNSRRRGSIWPFHPRVR